MKRVHYSPEIHGAVVAEALEPITDRIESAFIFGSLARGTETQGSDIDLMIIASPNVLRRMPANSG